MTIWKKLLNICKYVQDDYVEEDPERKISFEPEQPIEEKPVETKIKTRVKPFDKECTMYIIEYYIDEIGWERLEKNIFYNTVSLCTYNHPVLIPNFDEAVKKAKSLTLEYITKYNSERKIQFDYKMKQLSDKINERNKTFESE